MKFLKQIENIESLVLRMGARMTMLENSVTKIALNNPVFSYKSDNEKSEVKTKKELFECSSCHEEKALDSYYKNKYGGSGNGKQCIECLRKQQHKYNLMRNARNRRGKLESEKTPVQCTNCKEMKYVSEFHSRPYGSGHTSWCKECVKEAVIRTKSKKKMPEFTGLERIQKTEEKEALDAVRLLKRKGIVPGIPFKHFTTDDEE